MYAPLTSPQKVTRWLILQKARGQICPAVAAQTLPLLVSIRFQVLFHSGRPGSFHLSLTVLVHYRSPRVFSLGKWAPLFPTGLACPVVLKVNGRSLIPFVYGGITLHALPFQCSSTRDEFCNFSGSPQRPPPCLTTPGPQRLWPIARDRFGLFPFRSPLLREYSLFLGVLRCFSSPRSPLQAYVFSLRYPGIPPGGFPHSGILGSKLVRQLPEAYRSPPRPSSALGAKASTTRP